MAPAAGARARVAGSLRDRPLLSFQPLYLDTVQALKDLLTSLLQRNMTPQGLQVMVEVCGGCALPRGRDAVGTVCCTMQGGGGGL